MEARISPMNQLPAEKVVTEMALLLQQAIVGYRFHPTEEELVNYLKSKETGCRETFCIIPTLENIYEINPWDLPAKFNEKSIIRSKDQEWWFICPQTQNQRISRKTPCGSSWKITGKHKDIKAKNDDKKIGSKITLVFLDGRNSKGTRSNWVMHELHPHPDDMGFVLCSLKMKQDDRADNQEPSIQEMRSQPNDTDMATNGDFSSTPQFQCPQVSFNEPNEKADLVHSLEEKVDEMSGTSNFIGEQVDKSCDGMDWDNPEQLPFAEHHIQEMQNQLNELIMNGSSCSTEISSRSGMTVTSEWSRMEPLMSPLDHDSFPNGELFDYNALFSETEADIGVNQHGQLGETSWNNRWAQKNQRPVCDTLEGAVPLEEEEGFVDQKLNHPHDTEKIIRECTSSDGAPAKAKAAELKDQETTMIQPQKKKDDVEIESDNISRWETQNDSLSPMRSTASTSCSCRNNSTIDPRVYLVMLLAIVLLVSVIVDGICRIYDGANETKRHNVFYRGY